MEEEIITQEIDIGSVIVDTINNLCQSLFSSIDESVLPLLDDLVFIKEDVATKYLERILGTDIRTGLLELANSLLIAFVLYYAVRLMTSNFSGQTIEPPYLFILKAIFIAMFMNFSLSICTSVVSMTSNVSTFICSLNENIFKTPASFSNLFETFNSSSKDFSVFSLNGILSGVLSMSSFTLVISFALRYIMVKLLILISPFAILCLLNQSTVGLFKSWYKCFLTLLLLQVFVALTLVLSFSITREMLESPLKELLLVGTIIALMKSNEYVKDLLGGLGVSTNFQSGISGIKSIFSR